MMAGSLFESLLTLTEDSSPTTTMSLSFDHCLGIASKVLSSSAVEIQSTLHQLVHNWLEDKPPSYTGKELLTTMPDAVLGEVCGYLERRDLGAVLGVCKQLNHLLNPTGDKAMLFWAQEFRLWCPPTESCCFSNYLTYRLQFERNELQHWRSIAPLMSALKKVKSQSIVNISGNIGRFPDPRIARAVTRRRPQALMGVIVRDVSVAPQFRKLTDYRRAVSFMVTDSLHTAALRPPIEAKGFIGYALDLLELRPEEEHLRESVLAGLVYRDMTVWESHNDVEAALRSGAYNVALPFYCVLDDGRNDLEVMDDDAPRDIHGQPRFANVRSARPVPTAAYGLFRPRMNDVTSPERYARQIERNVAALEFALLNAHV